MPSPMPVDQNADKSARYALRDAELAILFSAANGGDVSAFGRLISTTRPKLLGVIRRICADREEAEDALQEVYLKAWVSRSSFDCTRGSVEQWMMSIARNNAIDRVRAIARRPKLAPNFADECPYSGFELSGPEPSEIAFLKESSVAVWTCLASLDAHQRQVLVLSFWKQLSHAEIASTTGCPLGTVKSWIRRSMESMRVALSAYAVA